MEYKKDISVVLGTYNRKKLLVLTIDSIREDLKKTNLTNEIIVIDGGSTDGTVEWLTKQKDVITIIQHNKGIWKGKKIERRSWGYFMNLGFKCSQGKYICMLSDDCLLVPNSFRNGIKQFEKELKSGNRIGGIAFFYRDLPNDVLYKVHRILSNKININHGIFLHDALAKINYIDEDNYKFYSGDSDLCLKLDYAGYKVIPSENSFVEHLHHLKNLSYNQQKEKNNNLKSMFDDNKRLEKKWDGIYKKINTTPIYKEFCDSFETYKSFTKVIPVNQIVKNKILNIKRIITTFFYDIKMLIKAFYYYKIKKNKKLAFENLNKPCLRWFKIKDKYFSSIIDVSSRQKIDVVIPVHIKDIDVLPSCVESIRVNVKHPINKIYIIADNDDKIISLCKKHECVYIDEDKVLDINKNYIKCKKKGKDISGWLYQQLLKYSAANFVEQENYLVADSDTLFISEQCFIDSKNKYIFDISDEYNSFYFYMYKKILNRDVGLPMSFIAHHMLFNKKIIRELLKEIGEVNKNKWYDVIINNVDFERNLCFSEYETYGNYIFSKYKNKVKFRYWQNKRIKKIISFEVAEKLYASKYLTISMQHYDRYE